MALIAHWPLMGSFKDISGHNYDLTPNTNTVPSFTDVDGWEGLKFEADTNSTVSSIFSDRDEVRSVTMWYYYEKNNNGRGFLFSNPDCEENNELHIDSDKTLRYILWKPTTEGVVPNMVINTTNSLAQLIVNSWNHIVVTRYRRVGFEVVSIYINGMCATFFDTKILTTGRIPTSGITDIGKICLGGRTKTIDRPEYCLKGLLRDVRVYSQHLTPVDVKNIYGASPTEIYDPSSMLHLPLNRAMRSVSGMNTSGAQFNTRHSCFNGVNGIVTHPESHTRIPITHNILKEDKFCISLWVSLRTMEDGDPGEPTRRYNILSIFPGQTGSFHILHLPGPSDHNQVAIGAWDSDVCKGPLVIINDLESNEWNHFSVMVDNVKKIISVYINGQMASSNAFANSNWAFDQKEVYVDLGGRIAMMNDINDYYFTHISDLRIDRDLPSYSSVLLSRHVKYGRREKLLHLPLNSSSLKNISKFKFDVQDYPNVGRSASGIFGCCFNGPGVNNNYISEYNKLLSLMERSFTVCFWVKLERTIADGSLAHIFGQDSDLPKHKKCGLYIGFRKTDTDILGPSLHIKMGNEYGDALEIIEPSFPYDKWVHVTVTFNGFDLVLKYDNVHTGIDGIFHTISRLSYSDLTRALQILGGNSSPFPMSEAVYGISDLRVYNYVLSDMEVDKIMEAKILDYTATRNSQDSISYFGLQRHFDSTIAGVDIIDGGRHIYKTGNYAFASGYNSGVPEPAKGYHAYWRSRGDGEILTMNDRNSECGQPHRWMGTSSNTFFDSLFPKTACDIAIRYAQRTNVLRKCADLGIYYSKDGTTYDFHDGRSSSFNTKVGEWEKQEDYFKYTGGMYQALYIYGHYFDEGYLEVKDINMRIGDNFCCDDAYHTYMYGNPNLLGSVDVQDLLSDSSGATSKGKMCYKLDGCILVDDYNSLTRFDVPLSFRFEEDVYYTASIEYKDVSGMEPLRDQNSTIDKTFNFQIQYVYPVDQASDNVIWGSKPTPDSSNRNVRPWNYMYVEQLADGWFRACFLFKFKDTGSLNKNPSGTSKVYFQSAYDYVGLSRQYYVRNPAVVKGMVSIGQIRPVLEDKSGLGNHGTTVSKVLLWNEREQSQFLNTKNKTLMTSLRFPTITTPENFTYFMEFKAKNFTGRRIYNIAGWVYGSQTDGIGINSNGKLMLYQYFTGTGTMDQIKEINVTVAEDTWYYIIWRCYGDRITVTLTDSDGNKQEDTISCVFNAYENLSNQFDNKAFSVNGCGTIDNFGLERNCDMYVRRIQMYGRVLDEEKMSRLTSGRCVSINSCGEMRDTMYFQPRPDVLTSSKDKLKTWTLVDKTNPFIKVSHQYHSINYRPGLTASLPLANVSFRVAFGRSTIEKVLDMGETSMAVVLIMDSDISTAGIYPTDINDCTLISEKTIFRGRHAICCYYNIQRCDETYQFIDFSISNRGLKLTKIEKIEIFGYKEFQSIKTQGDIKPTYRASNLYGGFYNVDMFSLPMYPSLFSSIRTMDSLGQNIFYPRVNPVGNEDLVSAIRMVNTLDGFNGGFDSANEIPVSRNRKLRFSIWMKREYMGELFGYMYLGANPDGTVGTCNSPQEDAYKGNCYFTYIYPDKWASALINTSDWVLVVGYIEPHGTTTFDSRAGVYSNSTRNSPIKFVPMSGVTYANLQFLIRFANPGIDTLDFVGIRSYLFYCGVNKPTQIAYLYKPRVDVCDGNEPSIEELLQGFEEDLIMNSANAQFRLPDGIGMNLISHRPRGTLIVYEDE